MARGPSLTASSSNSTTEGGVVPAGAPMPKSETERDTENREGVRAENENCVPCSPVKESLYSCPQRWAKGGVDELNGFMSRSTWSACDVLVCRAGASPYWACPASEQEFKLVCRGQSILLLLHFLRAGARRELQGMMITRRGYGKPALVIVVSFVRGFAGVEDASRRSVSSQCRARARNARAVGSTHPLAFWEIASEPLDKFQSRPLDLINGYDEMGAFFGFPHCGIVTANPFLFHPFLIHAFFICVSGNLRFASRRASRLSLVEESFGALPRQCRGEQSIKFPVSRSFSSDYEHSDLPFIVNVCRGASPRFDSLGIYVGDLLPGFGRGQRPRPFYALSLELRWKGGFDLTVEFTFLHCFSGTSMEDIEEPIEIHRLVDTITDEKLAWVAPEPRGVASAIAQGDPSVCSIVEDKGEGDPENWEVHVPEEGKRVCSEFSEGGFAMYEFAFKDLKFRLPFSDFVVGVFERLRLAPSQLHPNSLAFIRAFELLCDYLEVEPTLHLFFRIFKIQRQTVRGRQGWVSLKHHQAKIFRMFVDSVWGFKERYFVVKSVSPEAKKHFALPTDAYLVRDELISPAERAGYERIRTYVAGFQPVRFMTKAGVPAKDVFGNPRVEPRFVNTKSLLECTSRDTRRTLLGICCVLPARFLTSVYVSLCCVYLLSSVTDSARVFLLADNMADFADELVKIAADKKRVTKKKPARTAMSNVILSISTTPASSSSPVGAKGSPSVVKPPPAKRQRDDFVVDLETVEETKGFIFPPLFGMPGYLAQHPATILRSEKEAIMKKTSEELGSQLARDFAATLHLAEIAMVLKERGPSKEMEKLMKKNAELTAEVTQLGNTVTDLEGKQENYANLAADFRESEDKVRALEKEVAGLKISCAGERKQKERVEEELKALQEVMVPAEDEPEHVRGLTTRAELVGEVRAHMGKFFESARYSFQNAVAQLKIVNPGLVTEGTGMLRKVENGQIVIPEKYKQMEQEEEEEAEEDQEEDMPDVGEEESQGESDH
ncbi:hypothetical protein TSUD_379140 [Trifolium subterraneum]|uniref:Transposase (putative) gypsy type domain-containing protein n=1 Tax=Trifolium subterraneum TaxID=3900 RepID=A0A2Z6NUE9_TRISU|nr:hypothetical protein TSUD_379140 [Trifolium subterraneum]